MINFFEPWPKIPRLFSKCVVTEKIDGTNAQILVMDSRTLEPRELEQAIEDADKGRAIRRNLLFMYAFSRKRHIWPGKDNFAFASWVSGNQDVLLDTLGPGRHFGEWWGEGVGRQYGAEGKRLSLFNTARWGWLNDEEVRADSGVGDLPLYSVPVLYAGKFGLEPLQDSVTRLANDGSVAMPGFMEPEGIVCFFQDAGAPFKYVMKGDAHKLEDDAQLRLHEVA